MFGCTVEIAPFNAQPTPDDSLSDVPDTTWGHGEGSMPARDNADVGRSGEETHLSYWGQFWKTPGTPGVTAYSIYDTTVAGQIIKTNYNASGQSEGEQECHWIVEHVDEASVTGYNSYLILQNVTGGLFTYIAAYKASAVLYLCPAHQADGTDLTFATYDLAVAAIDTAKASETLLTTTGCNNTTTFTATSTMGEPWIFTTVQNGPNVCGDGIVGGTEECDDGNYVNGTGGDTCYNTCRSTTRPGGYAISAGGEHVCALSNNTARDVKCWGRNFFGNLGYGDAAGNGTSVSDSTATGHVLANKSPIALGWDTGVTTQSIAAGGRHTCALSSAGEVKCWGENSAGQLGLNNQTDLLAPGNEVTVGTGFDVVVAIAAGGEFTCALSSAGRVKCWGYNNGGALGQGNTTKIGDDPTRKVEDASAIALGAGFEIVIAIAIAANDSHACAVSSGGAVKCWGINNFGQLGQGNTDTVSDDGNPVLATLSPVAIGWSSGVTAAINTAGTHTCAVSSAGAVKCWGYNGSGQLGQGNSTNVSDDGSPTIASLTAVSIWSPGVTSTIAATGYLYTCALSSGGAVKCWGLHSYRRLGWSSPTQVGDDGDPTILSITAINFGWSSGVTTAITVGNEFACALSSANAIKCWGRNNYGQLGQGDTTDRGDTSGTYSVASTSPVAFGSGW